MAKMKGRLAKAIKYVRENMDEDDMAILQAKMNKCYNMHLIPTENLVDCNKVRDLLAEYGEENDLPESWCEEDADMADILAEL
jgi:hypothetical protein